MAATSDGPTAAIRASTVSSSTSAPRAMKASQPITQPSSSSGSPVSRTTRRTAGIRSRTERSLTAWPGSSANTITESECSTM